MSLIKNTTKNKDKNMSYNLKFATESQALQFLQGQDNLEYVGDNTFSPKKYELNNDEYGYPQYNPKQFRAEWGIEVRYMQYANTATHRPDSRCSIDSLGYLHDCEAWELPC